MIGMAEASARPHAAKSAKYGFGSQSFNAQYVFQGLGGPGAPCLKGHALRLPRGWAR